MSTAAYRAAHKEEIAAYRAAHKEEIAARDAAYRAAHKEEIAAYDASPKRRAAHKKYESTARAQIWTMIRSQRNSLKRGAKL